MSRSRPSGSDLFDDVPRRPLICGLEAEQISRRLRLLSEEAHRLRVNRAAVLIEIAAQIVELEGRALDSRAGNTGEATGASAQPR